MAPVWQPLSELLANRCARVLETPAFLSTSNKQFVRCRFPATPRRFAMEFLTELPAAARVDEGTNYTTYMGEVWEGRPSPEEVFARRAWTESFQKPLD